MKANNNKLTNNYLTVLRHRLTKSELPNYNQILKLAKSGDSNKKELKKYIKKAKKAYDSLLYINKSNS